MNYLKKNLLKKRKKRKEIPKDIKEVQITGVPKKSVPKGDVVC